VTRPEGDGRQRTRAALRAVRDAWSIFGLALLLLVAAELGLRLWERSAKPEERAARVAAPLRSESWFLPFAAARKHHVCCEETPFDPYRSWWGVPGEHEGLAVGADGFRVTPGAGGPRGVTTGSDPAVTPPAPQEVFLFGGSVMWGYTARDAFTIPAFVASELRAAGLSLARVHNKSQAGYNFMQGWITLALELRGGARPAAVAFLDGVNEVGVPAEGEPLGGVYGQRDAIRRLHVDSGYELAAQLAARLRVVERFGLTRPARPLAALDPARDCAAIAEHYQNLVRAGRALGAEFGFEPIFFFQPTLALSRKTLGPWERKLVEERGTMGARVQALLPACARAIDARLANAADYVPLHSLFDDEQSDVFLDHFGHVGEAANATIAHAIAQRLIPVLRASAASEARGANGQGAASRSAASASVASAPAPP
jgi:hypothetical protein